MLESFPGLGPFSKKITNIFYNQPQLLKYW